MCDARERADAVRACKWVDGVIEDVPYEVTDAFTDELFAKYGVDFVVHGTTRVWRRTVRTLGVSETRGKYREIKRTEGVSTTDIVGRLLRLGARAMGEEVEEEEKEATFCTASLASRSFWEITPAGRGRACRLRARRVRRLQYGTRGDFT